jgi:hypothetical protein
MSRIQRVSVNNINESRISRTLSIGSSSAPKVSFKKASDNLLERGVATLVSLKGEEDFPPEVECMAAEFKEVLNGEICSVVTPLTIKLNKDEDSTKVKISNLKKVMSVMKGENFPFYRVDRLKILYVPLFPDDEGTSGKISFSIQDTSIKTAGKPKKVSQAEAPLNKMSMIELSTNYFVPRKDIGMIEFGYKACGVPVKDRAFAAVYLAFYIHKDFSPATMVKKNPIILLIEDVERPKDVNSSSGLKQLCEQVSSGLEKKKRSINKRKMKFDADLENRFADIAIEQESSDRLGVIDEVVGSSEPSLMKENLSELLPRRLPIYDLEGAILDTGAPDHWIYNPNLVELEELDTNASAREGHNVYRVHGVEIKLGIYWVKLKEALYARKRDVPLISFDKLAKGGIIDGMKRINGSRTVLTMDNKVIFNLDTTSGYMKFIPSEETSNRMLCE